ncbi:glutathione S-transferase family protein [Curvivirga sp.]|uniref:glutathione S-transferase family protein n=1 Tax=Curvivirga sp. TaxID=2856848 RepID=UPI003B5ABF2B
MITLYHLWLSPGCRKVRLLMGEKKLEFNMQIEKTWRREADFLALNPTGEVPVIVDEDGTKVCGSQVICEYLDEMYGTLSLIGTGAVERAETRRLIEWFDVKFQDEVIQNLVNEKIMKRFLGLGEPNSNAIRAGHKNIHIHLSYIDWLVDRRKWLAGDELSLADLAAAAHLSCVDYLGDVPWADHPSAKDWYAKVKSRPSFRGLLADHIPGAPPPPHYADLDF